MHELPPERPGRLPEGEFEYIRGTLPLVYIDAVPVRVDNHGEVTSVGLLLREVDGAITRALVSGRVYYQERVRDALVRHIEKDLGPVALPRVPTSPQPFTVAEYFPTKGVSKFFDSRQHAVSLAFVVPIDGDCSPSQNALDLAWLTPEEAASTEIGAEMHGGQDVLLRQGLASVGALH